MPWRSFSEISAGNSTWILKICWYRFSGSTMLFWDRRMFSVGMSRVTQYSFTK